MADTGIDLGQRMVPPRIQPDVSNGNPCREFDIRGPENFCVNHLSDGDTRHNQ